MKAHVAKRRTRTPVNRLIAAADVAVSARREPPMARLKTIVVPVDFSAHSKNALRYAVRLAEQFGSVLRLVHVVETAPFLNDLSNVPLTRSDDEIANMAKTQLQALAQDQIDELIPVYPEVRIGKPYDEIVSAAKVSSADLIVIATHGYTGLKHAFLGSTAERVVRHAHCPVLVVRAAGRSSP